MRSNSTLPPRICPQCLESFTPNRPAQKHCSYRCSLRTAARSIRHRTPEERFWAKVDKSGECWLWTGRLVKGYGQFSLNCHPVKAHRFIWELTHGPIPDGLWVLHQCDTPRCVRIDHLFLGTGLDNIRDALEKGRMRVGERHYRAKLTAADVLAIRRRGDNETSVALAREFGVTPGMIRHIIHRRAWRHLP